MTHPTIKPVFAIGCLVAGLAQAGPVPAPAVAEAQLRAINHRFVDTFVASDPEFMAQLTHDDFLLTGSDGTWRERSDFLAALAKPSGFEGVAYDDVRVRLFGEVAVLHAMFNGVTHDGQVAKIRYTDVYLWDGSAWRLITGQNTPIKDPNATRQITGIAPTHAPWGGKDPVGDDLTVLRELNESYVDAFRRADVAWYDAHLSQDYVVVYGDGTFHDRNSALWDFSQPSYATHMKSFPVDKVRIRRFGDVALIHAENAYERKDGRKGINRYTDIWTKKNGRWVCVAAHITVHKPAT